MSNFVAPTFIINPRSAGGATGKKLKDLEIAIKAAFPTAELKRTDAPGAASRLAEEARRAGRDLVVIAGGDGSTNEVVHGLLTAGPETAELPMPTLGIIPEGTGCDLAKSLGLSRGLESSLKIITEGETRRCDVGLITCRSESGAEVKRYFINVASFGISGEVVNRVNRSGKTFGGLVSFGVATVNSLLSYRGRNVRLKLGDDAPRDVFMNVMFICNAQYCGGGMHTGKGARMDDGIFRVVAVEQRGLIHNLRSMPELYSGDLDKVDGVHVVNVSRIEALPLHDEVVLVECDGEQPGRLPAVYEVVPSAIPIRVGSSALTV